MTDYELGLLEDAYNMTMTKTDETELSRKSTSCTAAMSR